MSNIKWNLEILSEIGLKYTTIAEFLANDNNAYMVARRLKVLDKITAHIIRKPKPEYWDVFEHCRDLALQYTNKYKFKTECGPCYNGAVRNGWLDLICGHMVLICKPNGYWNIYENCVEEALKYDNITEFKQKASGCYTASITNGWLLLITKHFKRVHYHKDYWNIFEHCVAEALRFDNKSYFRKCSRNCYDTAEKMVG
jgi:hypothetical protein